MSTIPELNSVDRWLSANADRVAAIHKEIAAALGSGWDVVSTDAIDVARAHWREWTAVNLEDHYAALATPGSAVGPGLRHQASGIVFRVIPGGQLAMGMSEAEEAVLLSDEALEADEADELQFLIEQLPWMRPVRIVTLRPFLLAATPAVGNQLTGLGFDWEQNAVNEHGYQLYRLFAGEEEVTYLDPSEVPRLLDGSTLRLPSEAEWEHACRAGSTTPFFWGTEIPTAPTDRTNAFGLVELGNHAELCADLWHPSYTGAPSDGRPWTEDPFPLSKRSKRGLVVRGGSAPCYPWQECGEWQLNLSCLRRPVDPKGDTTSRQCCVRPTRDLPDGI